MPLKTRNSGNSQTKNKAKSKTTSSSLKFEIEEPKFATNKEFDDRVKKSTFQKITEEKKSNIISENKKEEIQLSEEESKKLKTFKYYSERYEKEIKKLDRLLNREDFSEKNFEHTSGLRMESDEYDELFKEDDFFCKFKSQRNDAEVGILIKVKNFLKSLGSNDSIDNSANEHSKQIQVAIEKTREFSNITVKYYNELIGIDESIQKTSKTQLEKLHKYFETLISSYKITNNYTLYLKTSSGPCNSCRKLLANFHNDSKVNIIVQYQSDKEEYALFKPERDAESSELKYGHGSALQNTDSTKIYSLPPEIIKKDGKLLTEADHHYLIKTESPIRRDREVEAKAKLVKKVTYRS